MMVSECLWVGTGPKEPALGKIVHCRSAGQAYTEIEKWNTVVVPTTDMAKDVLRLLGCGEAWIAFAVGGISGLDPVAEIEL